MKTTITVILSALSVIVAEILDYYDESATTVLQPELIIGAIGGVIAYFKAKNSGPQ
jgi:hypothetical protein